MGCSTPKPAAHLRRVRVPRGAAEAVRDRVEQEVAVEPEQLVHRGGRLWMRGAETEAAERELGGVREQRAAIAQPLEHGEEREA